jgi:hypothetical protein
MLNSQLLQHLELFEESNDFSKNDEETTNKTVYFDPVSCLMISPFVVLFAIAAASNFFWITGVLACVLLLWIQSDLAHVGRIAKVFTFRAAATNIPLETKACAIAESRLRTARMLGSVGAPMMRPVTA